MSNPCVKCGKNTTEQEAYEATILDLPPCCDGCEEAVSAYVANQIPFWPASWHGGYSWSKTQDGFIPSEYIDYYDGDKGA